MGLHVYVGPCDGRRHLFTGRRHCSSSGRRWGTIWCCVRRSFCNTERDRPFSQLGPRGSLIVNMAICVMLTTCSGGARWWRDFNEHRGLVGHHAWQESISFMWQKGTDHIRSFVSLSTISKVMGCSMGVCLGTPKALRRRFTWYQRCPSKQ